MSGKSKINNKNDEGKGISNLKAGLTCASDKVIGKLEVLHNTEFDDFVIKMRNVQEHSCNFQEPKRARRFRQTQNAFKKTLKYLAQAEGSYQLMIRTGSFTWKDRLGNIISGFNSIDQAKEYTSIRARKQRDNRAVCSCWMCGNPRRWFGEKHHNER